MPHFGKPLAAALGAALLSGTTLVPDAYAFAQDYVAPAAQLVRPAVVRQLQPVTPPLADESRTPPATDDDQASPVPAVADAELNCLAKIVLHEAGNQSRTGQLAVAQVVMNRVHSGRFAGTICGVALQRGQFFNVHAYNPPHDSRWRLALDVARDARQGLSDPVIGDALFFHAAYAGGIGNHHQVGRIGGNIFYR
jgi:spore germination cell wall hydrolase CwlJ-like protein